MADGMRSQAHGGLIDKAADEWVELDNSLTRESYATQDLPLQNINKKKDHYVTS